VEGIANVFEVNYHLFLFADFFDFFSILETFIEISNGLVRSVLHNLVTFPFLFKIIRHLFIIPF
jgi:hypothetical protein